MTGMARRTLRFALLYASEGAPIGFIWWALPTLLRSDGVAVDAITSLTAIVLLPWVFKFLWAPLVDVLRGRRWGYRAWIVTMQVAMAATMAPLAWIDPVAHLDTWRVLLVAHALAAATQDVAIDALAIGSVPATERGRLNGAMQAGMLVGRSVFGGGAVFAASFMGRGWVVTALVVWILAAIVVAAGLRPAEPEREGPVVRRRWLPTLGAAAGRPSTWLGFAFALTSAAGFEAAGQLAGPFLVDRGVAPSAIGVFFGVAVVAAMLTGGLAGGWLSDRWGRRGATAVFLCGFVAAILLTAALDHAPDGALFASLGVMYLFIGLFTAASYALFMDLTDPAIGATQFTAFMAATNACESWSAWAGGRLVVSSGYPTAFVVMSLVSIASLGILWLMRTERIAPPSAGRYDLPREAS
jgi:MFS family permease